MIATVLVETAPNSRHPYGAKGVGEAPIVPPLPAVACALAHITGQAMRSLPLTPMRVLDALDARAASPVPPAASGQR